MTSKWALRQLVIGSLCAALAATTAGCAKSTDRGGKAGASPLQSSAPANPGGFGKSLGPRPEFKGQPVPAGQVFVEHKDPVTSTTTRVTTTVDGQVLFDSGSSTLLEAAQSVLSERAKDMPQGVEVDVVGHTDSDGDEKANQTLSEARAASVASYLLSIRPDLNIVPAGEGELSPVADNNTPEGRAQNRRVVISYLKTN